MFTKRLILFALICTVAALHAHADQWWIPASAHANGAQGSVWRTDLVVHNPTDVSQTLTVTLLPQGLDNSARDRSDSLSIGPGGTLRVDDILGTLFAFDGTAAVMVDAPTDTLSVSSRTANVGPNGTFGQAIPGQTTASAFLPGQAALLLGLSGTNGRRTNVGWVNTEPTAGQVTVTLRGPDGAVIGTRDFDVQPLSQDQISLFSALGVPAQAMASAEISATVPLLPYASVVAAGSNDPIYQAALSELDASTELILPGVAHVGGVGSSVWTTDLWIGHRGSRQATVELEFTTTGGAIHTASLTDPLQPGSQVWIQDVVTELFGLDGVQGVLTIRADDRIAVTSRTATAGDLGTYGQFIPARSRDAAAIPGETITLSGVRSDTDFRSNLGLVALGGGTAQMVLKAADGSTVATASRTLQPGVAVQKSIDRWFGADDLDAATVEIAFSGAADARLMSYLSVVDNASSDPTFSEPVRGLGGDPGIESVARTAQTTTSVLSTAVEQSAPRARTKTSVDCLTVDYDGDTVLPGQSPGGKCWRADLTFDQCAVDFPLAGWGVEEDGSAGVDVCVIDGYPSSLTVDLLTVVTDLATQMLVTTDLRSDLELTLEFEDNLPAGAHLVGDMDLIWDGDQTIAWCDLHWDHALVGFAYIPTGILGIKIPYVDTEGHSTEAKVVCEFDGTEWVLTTIQIGYWRVKYYFNMYTGEIRYV